MVGGPNSNIYVSVTGPLDDKSDTGYRRPKHTWLLSIEPHHSHHIPGTPHKEREPIHYGASRNPETGVYTINTHPIESEPAIIGNILIVEAGNVSAEQVHKFLEEELGPTASTTKTRDTSDDEAEHWIRHAMRGMQERKISHQFDVDEFMMFAHGYMANRLANEAPALIAYPRIHKDHEKKSSKYKFWLTYPMAGKTKTNKSGEALMYGGLM